MADVFTHPWLGGLFGDAATSAALAAAQQLQNMLRVERAYTAALHATGQISAEAAAAVDGLLANPDLDMDMLRQGARRDGMVVPALVRQLKAQLPEQFHDALHTGLTSQDVIDTAFALSIKAIVEDFLGRLHRLVSDLQQIGQTHGDRMLMGRTRMQAAQPVSVADRLDIWRMPLAAHVDRLTTSRRPIEILSIGGPVGTRDSDDVARHMAAALQLELPGKAPHAMRAHVADFANVLSLITGSLGKMGQDIALMAQQGIDDIQLSSGGQSSAMAHKNNPIHAELLITLARFNATQLSGMHQAMVHEQERSGAAWTLEWMLLPQMLQATGAALNSADALLGSIERLGHASDGN
ncbi:3-carboxy-cis,cis-muconate cycloisomerase [Yoonia sp. SDW83-1]|uniref:3-carboxy-cis,cis-muconate cycloisomerase n=1 Tax=Yoonia sp. SDW83-1 TaxID=3366945 RepID=UPI00398C70D4